MENIKFDLSSSGVAVGSVEVSSTLGFGFCPKILEGGTYESDMADRNLRVLYCTLLEFIGYTAVAPFTLAHRQGVNPSARCLNLR